MVEKNPMLLKILYKGGMLILTCKLGNEVINCYDGTHDKEQLKKWALKKILLCPVCGKPYEYCHGKVKTPYFRHMEKNECEDLYSESETEEHLNGKRDLFEWIKNQDGVTNAILEGWIPATKQRPDIMFEYNGKKYVIEYQCSPIATEYIERHDLYQAVGITDIWICGTEKYLQQYHNGSGKKRINLLEGESKVYYDITKNCFYFSIDDLDKITKMNYKKIQCLLEDKINLIKIPKEYAVFNKGICINNFLFESMERKISDYDNKKEKDILSYLDKVRKYYPLFEIKTHRKKHTIFVDLYDKPENNILICTIEINMCYYNSSIQIHDCRDFYSKLHTNIKALNFLINNVYDNRKSYIDAYRYRENRNKKIEYINTISKKISSFNGVKDVSCNFNSFYYEYGIIINLYQNDFAIFIKHKGVDFCQRINGYWRNINRIEYENEEDIFNSELLSLIIQNFDLEEN